MFCSLFICILVSVVDTDEILKFTCFSGLRSYIFLLFEGLSLMIFSKFSVSVIVAHACCIKSLLVQIR